MNIRRAACLEARLADGHTRSTRRSISVPFACSAACVCPTLINSSYARAERDESLDASVIHPHTHVSTVSFPHPPPSRVHASTTRVESFKNLSPLPIVPSSHHRALPHPSRVAHAPLV